MTLPTTTRQFALTEVGSFHNLALQTVQIPSLQSGQVLVRIYAVSLNVRALYFITTVVTYSVNSTHNVVPLSDMAGEIVAVSEGVKAWKVGDHVSANLSAWGGLVDGYLTEYWVVAAHSLVAIPAQLSYEEASALPCVAITAYNVLFRGKPVSAGDAVLLLATGGVAMFALHAVAAAPTEVLLATEGRGVDHVVETAVPGTIMQSVSATRFGGTVTIIGDMTSVDNFPISALSGLIKHRSVDVRGIIAGFGFTNPDIHKFNDMLRLMRAHPETTRPVVDKAFTYLESQKHVGKVSEA
ncbi:GroES-like protein [Hymenopellis radicata]|nr:GroES-like protein [Hymenopellis radicata]